MGHREDEDLNPPSTTQVLDDSSGLEVVWGKERQMKPFPSTPLIPESPEEPWGAPESTLDLDWGGLGCAPLSW